MHAAGIFAGAFTPGGNPGGGLGTIGGGPVNEFSNVNMTDTFRNSALESFWQVRAGTWVENQTQLVGTGVSGSPAALLVYTAQSYADFTAQVAINNFTGEAGVVGGWQDGAQSGYAAIVQAVGVLLARYTAGVLTSIGSSFTFPSPGDVLRLRRVGTTLTVAVNGSVIITATDATHGTGRVGLLSTSAGFAGEFSDFAASA